MPIAPLHVVHMVHAGSSFIAHAQSTMSGWNGFLQIPHSYFALRLMYLYRFLCVTPQADVCPAGSFLVEPETATVHGIINGLLTETCGVWTAHTDDVS